MNKKALLLPYNSKNELFMQDRRGFKAPEWGFFGGDIKDGSTAVETVIKAAKKKLELDVQESDLEFLGDFPVDIEGEVTKRALYVYRTDQDTFKVLEGAGGHWLSYGGCNKRLEEYEKFDDIWEAVQKLVEKG